MARTKITKRKRVPTSEKPFACRCGTRFLKRTYLNAHIRKFHTDGENVPKKYMIPDYSLPTYCEKEMPGPSRIETIYSDEDWSEPDVSIGEPEEEDGIEIIDLSKEDDTESADDDDKEEIRDNDKKTLIEEGRSIEKNSQWEQEAFHEGAKGEGDMSPDGNTESPDIYEGRLFSKRTHPGKVCAPKRKRTVVPVLPEDDEIVFRVGENCPKRIVFELPGGKKFKLDCSFE